MDAPGLVSLAVTDCAWWQSILELLADWGPDGQAEGVRWRYRYDDDQDAVMIRSWPAEVVVTLSAGRLTVRGNDPEAAVLVRARVEKLLATTPYDWPTEH